MNDNPTNDDNEAVRESVLTQRLNVPRAQFKLWREDGSLRETEHWQRDAGGAYLITPAGQVRVLELTHVADAPESPPTVALVAVCAGAMNRVLRCRPPDGGSMVSVRLTGVRVFAASFRRGDRIQAVPTETEGIYEYDGGVPRRIRI